MIREPITMQGLGRTISFEMNFDLDRPHDRFVWKHLQAGVGYEPEVCWVMLRALRAGDTAIDVGANFGFFTLLMAKLVGKSGPVVAFEPGDVAERALSENVKHNGLRNITIYRNVVSRSLGRTRYYVSRDDEAGNSLWDPSLFYLNVNGATSVDKDTVALNDIMVDQPRLIKIDAEGSELEVLMGATKFLSAKVPFVVVELNPFGLQQMGSSTEALRDYMRGYGYDLYFLHSDDRLPTHVPPKTAVKYVNDVVVKNVLFSFSHAIAEAWPEAME